MDMIGGAKILAERFSRIQQKGTNMEGGTLPEPDPAEGSTAASEIAAARRDIEQQLGDGSLTLEDLFQMSDEEGGGEDHRPVGHMHIGAALMAMPHIDDERTDDILIQAGLDRLAHIDKIGTHQRQNLIEGANSFLPDAEPDEG